ncbi:MAG: hypothetical protein KBA61_18900 [Spirochaetes bacterium]|nr:hypothetical protein [Spirochaetota bacterium]
MKTAVFLLIIMLTGCITTAYKRSNDEYRHVYREFNRDFRSGTKVFPGVYGGVRDIDGGKYHLLQFDGLLMGAGRHLDVMLPLEGRKTRTEEPGPDGRFHETDRIIIRPGTITFRESSAAITGTLPAYLIFQRSSSSDMDAFYALFNQKAGQESDPVSIMKQHFKYDIADPKYPLALVKLDFTLNYSYSARSLVWEKNASGKTAVACEGVDIDKYDGPRFSVEWKERSKMVYGLKQAGYAGTVIADVVTSPVQLVLLLLGGLAGPGVR